MSVRKTPEQVAELQSIINEAEPLINGALAGLAQARGDEQKAEHYRKTFAHLANLRLKTMREIWDAEHDTSGLVSEFESIIALSAQLYKKFLNFLTYNLAVARSRTMSAKERISISNGFSWYKQIAETLNELAEINWRDALSEVKQNRQDADTQDHQLVEFDKGGGLIESVLDDIYRPLKKLVEKMQNGEYPSADPKYFSFFAQLCDIKKQLEDLLFE